MKCKNCSFFIRKDYSWGWCKKDGIDKESEQRCTVYLLGIYRIGNGHSDKERNDTEELHKA